MSQISMTQEEQVNSLRRYGYNDREAAFLRLAALHGGYFLRRQIAEFLGKNANGSVAALVERVLANEHANVLTFEHNTRLYHLCTRPFYAALGQEDNRNRRERQPLTIKNKLMGLDFVLAHPAQRFLATEQEKLDYFTRTLQIDPAKLPTKLYRSLNEAASTTRYFVDKYPIFLPVDTSPPPPVVSFCFVDEGLKSAARFETYLREYSRLFASLTRFHVIYVAATPAPFQWAARSFEQFVIKRSERPDSDPLDPTVVRLLDHFADRRRFDSKDFAGLDRDKLIRLRNDREAFSGDKYDALYQAWLAGGRAVVLKILVPERTPEVVSEPIFSTHLSRHNYDLFGSLTAF